MPDAAPIAVVPHGFGWTAAGAWATAAMGLIALIIRQVGPWKKLTTDADEKLRHDLMGRIDSLESQLTDVRTAQDAERERHAKEMREAAERHAAEMQILRHRLNNEKASLDALLAMLETHPGRVIESVSKIREMRAEQAQQIALEQGAIAGKTRS